MCGHGPAHGSGSRSTIERALLDPRLRARDEVVEDQLRPGLHAEVVAPHRLERERLPFQLLDLAHLDDPTCRLDEEHETEVHARDGARIVVEQCDEAGPCRGRAADLLGPFAAQAADHRILALAVARVDVAADPERVQVMEALLARSAQPPREQVRVVMRMVDDAVRNDLLQLGVVLDLRARPVLGRRMDGPEHSLEAAARSARATRRPERWWSEAHRGRPPPHAHGFAAARRHA